MELSDNELIASHLAGDDSAFKELIERYFPSVLGFARKQGLRDDAHDAVQEIFLKAWKNLKKFDQDKASFKTWLFIIVRTTVIDFLRRKNPILFSEIRGEDDTTFEDTMIDKELLPDEAIQKAQEGEALIRALDLIPLNYRTVLTLYYQEDMTFDEIGTVMERPLNTVKSWHRRALIELRKHLS